MATVGSDGDEPMSEAFLIVAGVQHRTPPRARGRHRSRVVA